MPNHLISRYDWLAFPHDIDASPNEAIVRTYQAPREINWLLTQTVFLRPSSPGALACFGKKIQTKVPYVTGWWIRWWWTYIPTSSNRKNACPSRAKCVWLEPGSFDRAQHTKRLSDLNFTALYVYANEYMQTYNSSGKQTITFISVRTILFASLLSITVDAFWLENQFLWGSFSLSQKRLTYALIASRAQGRVAPSKTW